MFSHSLVNYHNICDNEKRVTSLYSSTMYMDYNANVLYAFSVHQLAPIFFKLIKYFLFSNLNISNISEEQQKMVVYQVHVNSERIQSYSDKF